LLYRLPLPDFDEQSLLSIAERIAPCFFSPSLNQHTTSIETKAVGNFLSELADLERFLPDADCGKTKGKTGVRACEQTRLAA